MHGGAKFDRGAAKAARATSSAIAPGPTTTTLGEGTGVAERLTATPDGVEHAGSMDGETYEQWVAGVDVDTGRKKGRVREDANALRFVEVTVNGPKTWSLAAALHSDISVALDAAQDSAAAEIMGWVAQHATTRVGPRGRQVQVPVEQIEAAVIRHYTSPAGDPHQHLHLQINARVWAAGAQRNKTDSRATSREVSTCRVSASTSIATSPMSWGTTSPRRLATRESRASTAASTPEPTRPTGWSCCSLPTPAFASVRWQHSAWPDSTCAATAR